jgi:hypothetical protein
MSEPAVPSKRPSKKVATQPTVPATKQGVEAEDGYVRARLSWHEPRPSRGDDIDLHSTVESLARHHALRLPNTDDVEDFRRFVNEVDAAIGDQNHEVVWQTAAVLGIDNRSMLRKEILRRARVVTQRSRRCYAEEEVRECGSHINLMAGIDCLPGEPVNMGFTLGEDHFLEVTEVHARTMDEAQRELTLLMALLGYEPEGDEPWSYNEWDGVTVDPYVATAPYRAFPELDIAPTTDDAVTT